MATRIAIANAVLAVLNRPDATDAWQRLQQFSSREWRRSYFWLDASGLALPFASLAAQHGRSYLPVPVLQRFEANLRDHSARVADMFDHFRLVTEAIRAVGLDVIVQKGFSLFPDYGPDPRLRLQIDLDFLAPPHDFERIADLLHPLGYSVVARTPHEWRFETQPGAVLPHDDLYRPSSARFLELHTTILDGSVCSLSLPAGIAARVRWRTLNGFTFPALHDQDLFLEQCLHVLRHVDSGNIRISHLMEIAHFVENRRDEGFWIALEQHASTDPRLARVIGLVLGLARTLFEFDVPPALADWTNRNLTPRTRHWLDVYGRAWCLENLPGSKLSLYALSECMSPPEWRRHMIRRLFPAKRADRLYRQGASTSVVKARIAQARFVVSRLRFHFVELFRFAVACVRLHRIEAGHTRRSPLHAGVETRDAVGAIRGLVDDA